MAGHETRAKRGGRLASAALVAGLAIAAAAPALDNELVHDDRVLISQDARVTEPGHLAAIWTSDYWPGDRPSYVYRPVTTTSFALVARLGGAQRLVNLLLHVAASLLVLGLLGSLGLRLGSAVVGAALFAVHPIHSEVLALVVGRGELLAAVLGLAFLLACPRVRNATGWIGCGALFAFAVGSKESAIMLPALALVLRRRERPEESWPAWARRAGRIAACTAPAALALFAARRAVFGAFLAPEGHVATLYNPLADLPPIARALDATWLLLRYLRALVVPWPLSADWSLGALRPMDPPWDWRLGVLLVAAAAGVTVLARPRLRRTGEAVGVAFVLLALLPVSNLLFPAGVAFGERLAYLPSVGACLALATTWQRWIDRSGATGRRVASATAGLVVLAGLGLSVHRDAAWQDAEAFTRALVRDAPDSALAHGLRGVQLQETGRRDEAEREVRRSLEIAPLWHDAWDTLAELRLAAGDPHGAAEAWSRAGQSASASDLAAGEAAPLHFRAAEAWLAAGDCDQARRSLRACQETLQGETPPQVLRLARRLAAPPCSPSPQGT